MSQPNKLEKVALDHLAPKIEAAKEARKSAAELIAFAEGIEQEVKEVVGNRNAEVTVFGVPVYVYQDKAAYAWRQFQDKHPHIAERFMVEVTDKVLDKAAVAKEFPDLLREFQTREFRHVSRRAA